MADKLKVCKHCGLLANAKDKECVNCSNTQFLDKYKGQVVVLDTDRSDVAKRLNISANGKFALKYGQ